MTTFPWKQDLSNREHAKLSVTRMDYMEFCSSLVSASVGDTQKKRARREHFKLILNLAQKINWADNPRYQIK
jgi:hypothetical protein